MKRHEERFPSRDTSEPKARPEMQRVFLLDAGDRPLFFCHDYAEPERWSSTATIVFGDANGNVSRQGCAIAAGTRY